MPSLSEIVDLQSKRKAQPQTSADQLFSFINGMDEQSQKKQQKEIEDEKGQRELYKNLREVGYSPEAATKKATSLYRQTGFIEKMVNGERNVFQPPNEDTESYGLATRKTKADLAKTEAETAKLTAEAGAMTSSATLPEGFVRVGGKVVKDPAYKRNLTPSERTNKLQDEIDKKELSSMATNLPKLDQAFQAAEQLEDIFYKSVAPASVKKGDVAGGLAARFSGPFKSAGAAVGANPMLNRYLANRKAFSGLIAKGGFGEAGMLTNQDIERVVAALPNPGSTEQEAAAGFAEIKKLLGAARKRFEDKKAAYFGRNTVADEEPEEIEDNLSTEEQDLYSKYAGA